MRTSWRTCTEELGDARTPVGAFGGAEAAYRSVRRYTKEDPVADARLLLKLSWLQGWMDNYAGAASDEHRVAEAGGIRNSGRGPPTKPAPCVVWPLLSGRGSPRSGHQVVPAPRSRKHRPRTTRTRSRTRFESWDGLIKTSDASTKPRTSTRRSRFYEELDDLPGQAAALNLLGMFAYFVGDWPTALGRYERARATLERAGDVATQAFEIANIGEILSDQGHLNEAAARSRRR